ncbi:GreA/GreB family elongation factor [Prauserella endophytica]|nr:GreA/GreB family elongation factor [Prauserella endophytica]
MTSNEPIDESERAELEWLRAENALLRTQRDVLERVATGFAEDANATLLRRLTRTDHQRTTRGRTMTAHQRTWLTTDAFERLRDELAELRRHRHSAHPDEDDTLGEPRRQARIRQLEEILHSAVVGEAPPDDGVAEPGMVLTVRFDDDPATETFLLGVRDGGDADGLEVYSPESPLGRALAGARQGESRTYPVPSGATVRVTLVRAVPYGQHTAR